MAISGLRGGKGGVDKEVYSLDVDGWDGAWRLIWRWALRYGRKLFTLLRQRVGRRWISARKVSGVSFLSFPIIDGR